MYINSCFDSGNIHVVSLDDANNIQLNIVKDPGEEGFYQWFHFNFTAERDKSYRFSINNAGQASYVEGWKGYQVRASYDGEEWFCLPTDFDGQSLNFECELEQQQITLAYFAPYSYQRHLSLISWAQQQLDVELEHLGNSLDGRAMSLLTIGNPIHTKHKIWIFARQHPGESMAEWLVEGLLSTLLDSHNGNSRALLRDCVFYVVPNMNPDGAVRGHLRTNAAGINLNREWLNPSMEKSPEVFLVREKMLATGGDIFLDIHGDEAIPYNFVAGAEGIPSFDDNLLRLQNHFKKAFLASSAEFQDRHGYPIDEPGQANMTIATHWIAEQFKTLAYTLEMPFKDNNNLPDGFCGWSPERSQQLGTDLLSAIAQTLPALKKR